MVDSNPPDDEPADGQGPNDEVPDPNLLADSDTDAPQQKKQASKY